MQKDENWGSKRSRTDMHSTSSSSRPSTTKLFPLVVLLLLQLDGGSKLNTECDCYAYFKLIDCWRCYINCCSLEARKQYACSGISTRFGTDSLLRRHSYKPHAGLAAALSDTIRTSSPPISAVPTPFPRPVFLLGQSRCSCNGSNTWKTHNSIYIWRLIGWWICFGTSQL